MINDGVNNIQGRNLPLKADELSFIYVSIPVCFSLRYSVNIEKWFLKNVVQAFM